MLSVDTAATWGLAAVIVMVAAAPGIGGAMSAWLMTGEEPCRADLLVVVSGGARERLLAAARLYRRGYAPRLLVTGPFPMEPGEMRELAQLGVPPESLVAAGGPSSSTLEDILRMREIVRRDAHRSILLVTSPYHCRRVRFLAERLMAGLDVKVTVTSSESLYFPLDRWWKHRDGWDVMPLEYLKLFWAWLTVPAGPDVR